MNESDVIDRLMELGDEIDRHFARVDVSAAVLLELDTDHGDTSATGGSERSRRRLLLVAAAVLLVVAIAAALPGPRRTVARWFGIGTVEIRTVPDSQSTGESRSASNDREPVASSMSAGSASTTTRPATTTTSPVDLDALGPPVSAAAAMEATGLPLPVATALGEPASWRLPGGRQIVGVYPVDDHVVLVGLLGGLTDSASFSKQVTAGFASRLMVDGAPGVWITGGEHLFAVLDESGVIAVDPVRVAVDTLLWERDGLTYRIEGATSLDQALTLAESVETRTEP